MVKPNFIKSHYNGNRIEPVRPRVPSSDSEAKKEFSYRDLPSFRLRTYEEKERPRTSTRGQLDLDLNLDDHDQDKGLGDYELFSHVPKFVRFGPNKDGYRLARTITYIREGDWDDNDLLFKDFSGYEDGYGYGYHRGKYSHGTPFPVKYPNPARVRRRPVITAHGLISAPVARAAQIVRGRLRKKYQRSYHGDSFKFPSFESWEEE